MTFRRIIRLNLKKKFKKKLTKKENITKITTVITP